MEWNYIFHIYFYTLMNLIKKDYIKNQLINLDCFHCYFKVNLDCFHCYFKVN